MVTGVLDALRSLMQSGGQGIHVIALGGGGRSVLSADGTLLAGSGPPDGVLGAAATVITSGRPIVIEHDGSDWFIEPVLPAPRLLVFGAIAVADSLVPMAAAAGFDVEVIDPRPWLATTERHPAATAVHCGEPIEILDAMEIDSGTAIVSFLHEERLEDPVLRVALSGSAGYVGSMGSRRTTARKRERLLAAGVDEETVARLHAPIGLDIAAVTPQEIAVAVLGEIVAVRRGSQ
jgi:xanthine dehydrogenase accessory factor